VGGGEGGGVGCRHNWLGPHGLLRNRRSSREIEESTNSVGFKDSLVVATSQKSPKTLHSCKLFECLYRGGKQREGVLSILI
jgi:hypothetical protein